LGEEHMVLLIRLVYGRKILALTAVCASGLTAAVTLWWNWLLSGIINMVSVGKTLSLDMIICAVAAMLLLCVTNFAKGCLAGYACESMSHDLRMGYARHFVSLPFSETEKLNEGEQLSKLQNEIAGVSNYLSNNLFQLLDDGIRFVTTFCWLMFINPTLTLTANLPAFAVVAYVFFSSGIIEKATERSQQAKGNMNQYAGTLLTLFPILRLYDGFRLTLGGYGSAVGTWEKYTAQAERVKARLMSLSGLLSGIPLLLLFLAGGRMAISGVLSVGTLYIFLNLSGNVSGVLMNMPGYFAAFRQFSANARRLSPHVALIWKGKQI